MKKILDVFSKGAGGVKKFTYDRPLISADALDKFIERNKSAICSLSFIFTGQVSEEMDSFLPEFLKCPGLVVSGLGKLIYGRIAAGSWISIIGELQDDFVDPRNVQ